MGRSAPARPVAWGRELFAVHNAVFVGTGPGHRPGKEEKPLGLDRVNLRVAAEGAKGCALPVTAVKAIFIFSLRHYGSSGIFTNFSWLKPDGVIDNAFLLQVVYTTRVRACQEPSSHRAWAMCYNIMLSIANGKANPVRSRDESYPRR